MGQLKRRVYWANAMFNEADRAFNARCAEQLRVAGISVFLPQESTENASASPSADVIFRQDSAEILQSDVMVACLDQETIDPGVCCEIGVAFLGGVPIIGLYTDIRQNRTGPARMYKNLYVVGAVLSSGGIVSSIGELIPLLQTRFSEVPDDAFKLRPATDPVEFFSAVAPNYQAFVAKLESWYDPPWSATNRVGAFVGSIGAHRILEIGCGTGETAAQLISMFPTLSYVGLDTSSVMLKIARSRELERAVFTESAKDVERAAAQAPFDAALALFTLHDHPDPKGTLRFALENLAPGGFLLVIDLSISDLPEITRRLKGALVLPSRAQDVRLEPSLMWHWVRELGGHVAGNSWHVTSVSFPTAQDLDDYFEQFGIYHGYDLPLGLGGRNSGAAARLIREEISHWEFPFSDTRCFAELVVKR